MFRISPAVQVEEWMHSIAQRRGLVDEVQEIKVLALTFVSLIAKHGIAYADLLQVDTEGFDWEIVKMAFEVGIFPEIINFEYSGLSFRGRCESRRVLESTGTDSLTDSETQVNPWGDR